MAVSIGFSEFCKVGRKQKIKSFGEVPRKYLLIAFDLIKLVFTNLVFIFLDMLSPKMTALHVFNVKGSL